MAQVYVYLSTEFLKIFHSPVTRAEILTSTESTVLAPIDREMRVGKPIGHREAQNLDLGWPVLFFKKIDEYLWYSIHKDAKEWDL